MTTLALRVRQLLAVLAGAVLYCGMSTGASAQNGVVATGPSYYFTPVQNPSPGTGGNGKNTGSDALDCGAATDGSAGPVGTPITQIDTFAPSGTAPYALSS